MKITDAFWEKRNLGLDVVEITLEPEDTHETIRQTLSQIQGDYVVVKVPSHLHSAPFLLTELGFVFMECLNYLEYDFTNPTLSEKKEKLLAQGAISLMSEKDVDYTMTRLKEHLFTTDRISKDPHFTLDDSARRYCGFISDGLKQGTQYFNVLYQGEVVGFSCLKKHSDTDYEFPLSCIYPEHAGKGYSTIFVEEFAKKTISAQGKRLFCYISMNNIDSLISMTKNKNRTLGGVYIYVKHQKGASNL